MAVLHGRGFSRQPLRVWRQATALPSVWGQPQQPRGQGGQLRGGRAAPAEAPDVRRFTPSERIRTVADVPHRALPSGAVGAETLRGSPAGQSARSQGRSGRSRRVLLRTGALAAPGHGGRSLRGPRAVQGAHGDALRFAPSRALQRSGAAHRRSGGDFGDDAGAGHRSARLAVRRGVTLRGAADDAHALLRAVRVGGVRAGRRG